MSSSERRAVMRLWHRVFFLSFGGMFLAELFVMWFLGRLGMRWGFSGALVDALLLTMLVLPILYFTALQPVSRLAASLATVEADARFRIVVETTSDGILIADRTGRILYANPAALDMLGYSAGELDGVNATVLVPVDLRQRHGEGMGRFVETGEGRVAGRGSMEVEAQAKDGGRIPVELAITDPLPSEGGPLIALVRDLRSRKRIHLYKALLPTCSVCGLVRDDTGVERGQGRWGEPGSLRSGAVLHAVQPHVLPCGPGGLPTEARNGLARAVQAGELTCPRAEWPAVADTGLYISDALQRCGDRWPPSQA